MTSLPDQPTLFGDHMAPPQPPSRASRVRMEDIRQVFDQWVGACGKTSATRLDDKRARLIRKALEMYPLQDVLDAVVGWRRSDFYMGNNDRHKVYNHLEMLLRDAAHIEKFRDMEREHKRRHRGPSGVHIQQL